MNKSLNLSCALVLSGIGSYIPVLLGDSIFGGWSILGGLIGGLLGIYCGVFVSRRWG